ncbi:MAG: hypothetical protein SOS98_04370 [Varibaculum sp.]|nr:hypothetical protein [Varibaculum sp.]
MIVTGAPGTGYRELAELICQEHDMQLRDVDADIIADLNLDPQLPLVELGEHRYREEQRKRVKSYRGSNEIMVVDSGAAPSLADLKLARGEIVAVSAPLNYLASSNGLNVAHPATLGAPRMMLRVLLQDLESRWRALGALILVQDDSNIKALFSKFHLSVRN